MEKCNVCSCDFSLEDEGGINAISVSVCRFLSYLPCVNGGYVRSTKEGFEDDES